MNIKKILVTASMALIMLLAFSFQSSAAAIPSDSTRDAATAAHIVARVNEIDNMDKTTLSVSERKALKSELKDLQKQANGLDQKVYLSIGAIIIIILLLILIL